MVAQRNSRQRHQLLYAQTPNLAGGPRHLPLQRELQKKDQILPHWVYAQIFRSHIDIALHHFIPASLLLFHTEVGHMVKSNSGRPTTAVQEHPTLWGSVVMGTDEARPV